MPKHELAPLPYSFDALEPHIDAMTMEIHHDRHHAAYIANLNAAAAYLRGRPDVTGQIGAMGWCFGGGIALSYGLEGDDHDATAIFYGALSDDPEVLATLDHEVYGSFGQLDSGPSPEQVMAFEAALDAAGIDHDLHIYDEVGHAFWLRVDDEPEVRSEPSLDAWQRLKAYLERRGHDQLPSPSTITEILRRNDQIDAEEARKHRPFQRFEMEKPNQLWQMDFKGYFALEAGGYCHPLTVLDDHSRFLLGLKACPNETCKTVQEQLSGIFRCYGLPERMLMDNGAPWGDDANSRHTILTAWLIRLGVQTSHGRPYHPQTQGKDERLHRTLQDELLSRHTLANLPQCQLYFDDWRDGYNCERPHEALQMETPASHYQPSPRPFPEVLPPILYDPGDTVRKVDESGKIYFANRIFRVGRAFRHTPVGLRPTNVDGVYDVYYCHQKVAQVSLRGDNC